MEASFIYCVSRTSAWYSLWMSAFVVMSGRKKHRGIFTAGAALYFLFPIRGLKLPA